MAGFDNNAITVKGAVAIAALVAGGNLEFTRIAVGDGKLGTGQTPIMMENLVHWLFDVQISEVRSDSEAQATVLGTFSNKDNETEYYYRELGLFAKDPATGAEILYCYANAGDDAEKIPAAGGSSLLEKEVRIVTLIGNATSVTAKINSGLYPTFAQMDAKLILKADLDRKAAEGGRVVASQMRFDPSQTLYVDAAASATGADGSEAKPFKTIQAAVDAAYRGADLIKIEIKPGTYSENVKTPTGTGSSWVFEKYGTGTVSAKSFAIDIAPYVRIEGITLTPDAAGRAIRLVNVAAAAIESNTINGNATGFGLSIFRGSARLNGNRINNAGTAIYAAEGAQVTSIGTIGEGNAVGLHAEGAIILQHADANIVATTPFKASNGGAVNVEGGASSFPSSFGQMSSLGSFSTAAALRDRLLSELAKLKAGEWKMFSFQQTISGGFGALGAGQTSHVHMQKTAGEANSYGMLTFFSHASAPVSTMRVSNGAFSDNVPIVLIDETRIATAERYGIMKAATDDVVIDEDTDDAAITPAVYHDVSDFRHKSTAYALGDKVECMFNFELFLECTKAGTTGSGALNTRNVTHGQVITDGTVQWTVRTHMRSVNGVVPDATGNIPQSALGCLPLAGGTMTGSIVVKRHVLNTESGASIYTAESDSELQICAGSNNYTEAGGILTLYSQSAAGDIKQGGFTLAARKGDDLAELIGAPDGTLFWNEKDVMRAYTPTSTQTDLGNIASETVLTAPDDGWMVLSVTTNNSGITEVRISNETTGLNGYQLTGQTNNRWVTVTVPVSKGDQVRIYYGGANFSECKFIYARGAV